MAEERMRLALSGWSTLIRVQRTALLARISRRLLQL